MKKIFTTLLLITSLSGALVAAEVRGTTGSNATMFTTASNPLPSSALQRWRRQRRRRMARFNRRHRNSSRWNNGRGSSRWNNRRWRNRRRGGGGHDVH